MLLHYKSLITSLIFPFRTIQVEISVRNVVRSSQGALKTKWCVNTWAWTAGVFECLTATQMAAEHMHVSGALSISISHQLRVEKEENWFSLLPWVSYIRSSGMMQFSGGARRLRLCSFSSWTAEGGEKRTASWLLFCGFWCETRAELGLEDLETTFKIHPAISLASSGAIVLQ